MTAVTLQGRVLRVVDEQGDAVTVGGTLTSGGVPWDPSGIVGWYCPIMDATGAVVASWTPTFTVGSWRLDLTAAQSRALGVGSWEFVVVANPGTVEQTWFTGALSLTPRKQTP